jgi:putative transposase
MAESVSAGASTSSSCVLELDASLSWHDHIDLRERVILAVERDGLSRNEAARRFGIAISTAVNWLGRHREMGSVDPGKIEGHKPRKLIGGHRVWLLERTKTDFTLRGLQSELAERGIKVDYRTVWSFARTISIELTFIWSHRNGARHLARPHLRSSASPYAFAFKLAATLTPFFSSAATILPAPSRSPQNIGPPR